MKILCLAFLVAVLLLPAPAQNAANGADVSRIIALEKAWNQAFKFRDTKAIDALLDDAVVLVNDDGSLQSKSVFLAFVRESKASDDEQVTPESISVHIFGNVGVATGVFHVKGVAGGKPFVRRNRFADTWLEKNGNWVCVSASATPISH